VACCAGNVSAVDSLLLHGANPNAFDRHRLATPLFCAVVSTKPNHVACVEAMLNGGANINAGLHDLVIILPTFVHFVHFFPLFSTFSTFSTFSYF
jgi:ankyrin repeat protein